MKASGLPDRCGSQTRAPKRLAVFTRCGASARLAKDWGVGTNFLESCYQGGLEFSTLVKRVLAAIGSAAWISISPSFAADIRIAAGLLGDVINSV